MLSVLAKNAKLEVSGTVANAFSNLFLSVTESVDLYRMGTDDVIRFLKDAFTIEFRGIMQCGIIF
jgi:hypothetical protein